MLVLHQTRCEKCLVALQIDPHLASLQYVSRLYRILQIIVAGIESASQSLCVGSFQPIKNSTIVEMQHSIRTDGMRKVTHAQFDTNHALTINGLFRELQNRLIIWTPSGFDYVKTLTCACLAVSGVAGVTGTCETTGCISALRVCSATAVVRQTLVDFCSQYR